MENLIWSIYRAGKAQEKVNKLEDDYDGYEFHRAYEYEINNAENLNKIAKANLIDFIDKRANEILIDLIKSNPILTQQNNLK